RAIDEIFSDLTQTTPMNRLLQGDVGSGKTVVAAVGMYVAHLNGFQSALMAPTQILAEQHYATITRILEPLGVSVQLIKGGSKSKLGNGKWKMENGKYDVIIGTHALLHAGDIFEKLG